MNHRVLVTGGMGFVGGRVSQSLSKRSDVSLTLGSRVAHKNPLWLPSAQVINMDWCSQQSLILACEGINTLVHLAGLNAFECLRDPVLALEVNAVNTARLMLAAKEAGVGRVIYFSTAHVYGASLAGQIDELSLTKSRHPYSTSHRAAEDIVFASANDNFDTIVLRLSNGFGVPSHAAVNAWMLLMNDLCWQAVTSGSLTLRSTGLQLCNFITLHDVGRVVGHMLDLPKSSIGDGLFNIGSGESSRVIDMVKLIQTRCNELFGFSPKIIRPNVTKTDRSSGFDYKIDKLLSTGFALNGNPTFEIDETLRMCDKIFVVSS